MLNINHTNALSKKVGRRHGIAEASLRRFCERHQDDVQQIFDSKNQTGYHFVTLPDEKKELKRIKEFVVRQKKEGWKNIVVFGIGGSALGTIAVRDGLLDEFSGDPKLHVVDNIDPTYIARLLGHLELSKTLFIVISKSGTTTETMAQYALAKERLMKQFPKNYQKHLVFVTDPKEGLLKKIAEKEGIQTFEIPPKIGGRFSVLTSVGLLPCTLVGMDIDGLLKGAAEMRDQIKKKKTLENPALCLAALQFLLDKKKAKPMTVLMPYSNYLFRMGDWYRQLLAESIGKNKKTGPTPINALGTTDQHSQLQLYNDGPNNKFLIFLRVPKHANDPKLGKILPDEMSFLNGKKMSQVIDAAYQGTASALTKHQRPNVTIEVPKLDAYHLGAIFMLFEFQVALLGIMYKVDAFNQPGVEHSKKITEEILKQV